MSLLSSLALGIKPYVPGEQPKDRKYVKINTNENPNPPSPLVKKAIQEAADSLMLYPDPECSELRRVLAEYHGLNENNFFIGNGSDEILGFSFMAFFGKGSDIYFPDVTYSFYPVYCGLLGINGKTIPVGSDFKINVEEYSELDAGIVICNPNAPTSIALSVQEIESILGKNRNHVVIVDEAYVDFGAQTCIGLIDKYSNLVVVRTFSKSRSLAGMRVGYAAAQKDLIEGLNRIKNSFNSYTVDRLAQAAAIAAVKDNEYFLEKRNEIIKTREWTMKMLAEQGFKVMDSKANFVFASHRELPAKDIFAFLRSEGILVRYFDSERLKNHLRITIGSPEEMKILEKALKKLTMK